MSTSTVAAANSRLSSVASHLETLPPIVQVAQDSVGKCVVVVIVAREARPEQAG